MAWDPKKQHQGGELMIDHRASPGLPPDIARQCGFDPALSGEGKLFEAATLTCAHCKIALVKNLARVRPRENCPKCSNHYICDWCYADMQHPDYVHLPYEKLRDDTLEAGMRGIILGSPIELLRSSPKPPAPAETSTRSLSNASPSGLVAKGIIGHVP